MTSKIIANFVVRNEADKYLPQVLERVRHQVDAICITDDCSDDDTFELAKEFTPHAFRMAEPTFATHEGKLRQAAWDNLETCVSTNEPWWVLAIDADEMLYETGPTLRHLTDERQQDFNVLGITFFHMWNPTQFRVDKAWRPNVSSRLFRYRPDGYFLNRQLACGSEPTYVQEWIRSGKFFPNTGLHMKHLSYETEEGKKSKYERYSKIDGGAFHANAHIESIMDSDPELVDWTWV